MGDVIVRATAAKGNIRAFAAYTKDTAEAARMAHDLSPVAAAALGRTLTASAMMAVMMKGDDDLVTLQIRGDGPMKGITVTANAPEPDSGLVKVKGYALVPDVILPAKVHEGPSGAVSKLDVGGALGNGTLYVVKDLGLKDPYVGQVELVTGEIAEDIAYYYAVSEQVPSAVGLGVLMEKNNTVKHAGGFMIQLMPGADEKIISDLEARLSSMPTVTTLLDEGLTASDMLSMILEGYDVEFTDENPVKFSCNCSRERVQKALISLGKEELSSMINEGKDIEMKCSFCNKAYTFSPDEMRTLLQEARID
ncbi:MAG: Hsp33 family molecular chaperone HslO [Lachnospiraceae bacterium]|nr:Hsp33 family molecular chaperone HslO [Lachnospiraceae bacterium]